MNREIKFRAWDNTTKRMYEAMGLSQMVYDEDCSGEPEWKHTTEIQEVAIRERRDGVTFEKPNWVPASKLWLMQYTGLKDKNGVEVYEDDICWDAHNEYYGKVIFDEGEYRYEWDNIIESLREAALLLEVSGNIYENPELLDAQQGSEGAA